MERTRTRRRWWSGAIALAVLLGWPTLGAAQTPKFPGQLFTWNTPQRALTKQDTAEIAKEVEAIQAFLGLNGTNVLSSTVLDTSTELRTLVTDETGTGSLVFANTPQLITPIIGSFPAGSLPTPGTANRVAIATSAAAGSCTVAGATRTWCRDTGAAWEAIGGGGSGSGTVTSVAAAVPAEFTISGGPITGSGTLTIGKANQSPNLIFAGPGSGGAAAPTFRALVAADIPGLDTSKLGSGTLATARGGLNFNASTVAKGGLISGTGAGTYGLTVVGTNDKVLTADSTAPGGVAWKDPPTGSGDIATVGACTTGTCFASVAQNLVFASPTGSTGAGDFRALVANDIPSLAASKITSGTLATARGGFNADVSTIAKGGIVAGTGAGAFGILPSSTDGLVLTLDASQATGMRWGAAGSGTVTGTGTGTRLAFWDSTNGITSDIDLTYNSSTNRFDIETGEFRTTRFGGLIQNELRSLALQDSGPAAILRNVASGNATGDYLHLRNDHNAGNEFITWLVDKGGLIRTYASGGMMAGQRDPYWWPSRRYGKNQRVIAYPSNGSVYVAVNVTEGVSATAPPMASASNPKGWPRPFVRYTTYAAGERVVPMWQGDTGRRYRVQSNCTTATKPTFCTTADCTVTSGTCTFECDDGVCAGGANLGKSCSEADALTDCPGSTCTECSANSARVSGVTDGGVTWDWFGFDAFDTLIKAKSGGRQINDYDQVVARHGDNHPGPILADRGWAGTGAISGPMIGYSRWQGPQTFATYDMSVRANHPSIHVGAPRRSPTSALVYFEPRNPGDSRQIDNPENAPRLTATSGGSPGLSAGCRWIAYGWESDLNPGKTAMSPPASVFVDGTTSNAVLVELVAPYPADATRAVIYRGFTAGACPTVAQTADQVLFFRTAIIQSPANSFTFDGDDLTEQEMAFDSNTTAPRLLTINQPHTITTWAPNTAKEVGLETLVVPIVRNGHKYILYGNTSGNTKMPEGVTPGAQCTTGASEPEWAVNVKVGGFVTDNTCIWKHAGDDLAPVVFRAPANTALPTFTWRENVGLTGYLSDKDRVLGGVDNDGRLFFNKPGNLEHPSLRLSGDATFGGSIEFGVGSAAPDVTLARSGGSTLSLSGNLVIGGNLNPAGTFTAPSDGIDFFPIDTRTCNPGDFFVFLDLATVPITVRKCVDGVNMTIGDPDPVAFANLGTPANGTERYCSNCTFANPCASGGTGAIAKRLNGAWRCD